MAELDSNGFSYENNFGVSTARKRTGIVSPNEHVRYKCE